MRGIYFRSLLGVGIGWILTAGCSPAKTPAPETSPKPPPPAVSPAPVQPLGPPPKTASWPEDDPDWVKMQEINSRSEPQPWEERMKYPKNPRACAELEGTDCHWLCVRYVATLLPAPARRSIECLWLAIEENPGVADQCDTCARATCTSEAFAGVKGRGDPRCYTSVRKEAGSDGSWIAEGCGQYTAGMNQVGRNRFIACVLANMGTGFGFCLWDNSASPCQIKPPEDYVFDDEPEN